MWDEAGRYCIIFNGEIFNYRELRKTLIDQGVSFHSQSGTEVLLKHYIKEKEACLNKLNGFFSFCIYDKAEQTFFLARDRYGIKPLLYLFDEDKFIFGSEMKSIIHYGIDKEIDYNSLYTYLQLNYIPAPSTIFTHVKKLLPGNYIIVSRQKMEVKQYYEIPVTEPTTAPNYDEAKTRFATLLEQSVQKRLVADVPLGSFLSGGVDSSVITALAKKHKSDLHTFSSMQGALEAIRSASHPHHFLSVTKQGVAAIVSTIGNRDCHLILRGGSSGPNYGPDSLAAAREALQSAGLPPRLMIDCSHANSGKDHVRQAVVAEEIAAEIADGQGAIAGVMMESFLEDGRQDHEGMNALTYGQSITDACMSWTRTAPLFDLFAQAVRARRRLLAATA
jgi:asparagine synthetase B (glutamine-hydrolysing)